MPYMSSFVSIWLLLSQLNRFNAYLVITLLSSTLSVEAHHTSLFSTVQGDTTLHYTAINRHQSANELKPCSVYLTSTWNVVTLLRSDQPLIVITYSLKRVWKYIALLTISFDLQQWYKHDLNRDNKCRFMRLEMIA